MNIRANLDLSPPNSLADLLRETPFGSLLNALIKGLTMTETGVTPNSTTQIAVLANQPSSSGLLRALATAETGTVHEKEILVGPISGPAAIIPPANVCVWDGGKNVLFNTADAVTAVSFLYLKDADTTVGYMQRSPGIRNTP